MNTESYEERTNETQDEEVLDTQNEEGVEESLEKPDAKKKRERKEPVNIVREDGKSLLPFSRVQKIIKADKDIPIVAKDATFLVSLATEEFIKRLAEASQRVAERHNRATVQQQDIAAVLRKADEFVFLAELIPFLCVAPESTAKRKPKAGVESESQESTFLDHYVKKDGATEVVINGDGTMQTEESMQDVEF